MATLTQGQAIKLHLSASQTITVTPASNGRATVSANGPGNLSYPQKTIYSAETFGPYVADAEMVISAVDGPIEYSDPIAPSYSSDASGNLITVTVAGERFSLSKDYTATVMPDEIVRVTSTGNGGSGGPGYVSRIRCITGTSVALTVQDNPGVDVGGTEIYSGTLSAGEEAVLSAAKVPIINGTRLTWTGSASFDVYTGQEAP